MDWKERIEKAITDEDGLCCDRINCADCILVDANGGCGEPDPDDVTLPFLYRHLLATVKDFDDDAEIRARIAEMLDDDAREKFLGKAEPEERYFTTSMYGTPYKNSGGYGTCDKFPDMGYVIILGNTRIAAFRDEALAYKVAAFLNGETDA